MVTVPQIFHPLHIYPCPDLPFTTVDIFTVFSFASSRIKYHTVGIKNIYIAFSHWFLLLKKKCISHSSVFKLLDSTFLSSTA